MKSILLLILLAISTYSLGHETYFAFAEMEYDEDCSCLEISIKVSAHDLNSIVANEIKNYTGLEKVLNDDGQNQKVIKNFIIQGFSITQNQKEVQLFYEGFELNNDGNCLFFLRTEELEKSAVNIQFDLFMDSYIEQQNKLIYKKSNHSKEPYSFFESRRETEITL